MEKLGVQYDDEKTKTAGTDHRCPKCGADLHTHFPASRAVGKSTNVRPSQGQPWCPNCGTEPFEARPPTKE